jgi:hypothetical protein
MIDRFGREIFTTEDGKFYILDKNGDMSIIVDKAESLDAMAPEDWVNPNLE